MAAQNRLVLKILLSIGLGGVAYAATQLVPSASRLDVLLGVVVSVFVGGVVFVVQFLVDVDERLHVVEHTTDRSSQRIGTHTENIERELGEGFSKIRLATELFGLAEASQMRADEMAQVTKLVRRSTKIAYEAPGLVQRFANAEIARLSDYLKQLGDGSDLTYEGEDRDWLLGLTGSATTEIRATSLMTVDTSGRWTWRRSWRCTSGSASRFASWRLSRYLASARACATSPSSTAC
ncbi:MAG: hypothetical protein AUI14_10220 [Actinobacteria bacterium 13_2_20CM_2_71_6]|nr:MAG: hypothetical protein AUI14_10220 [Actinobacteria bacterium 13_2_20CM_2_71_6]